MLIAHKFLLQRDRGPTLCVLSLPLDLSVSDFCEFLGAYLEQVQQMRFLQREGARAPSLVVISFKEQSLADQFFQHFNTKPVCRNARATLLWRHMLGKRAVKA